MLDAIEKPYFNKYQEQLADFYSVLKSNEEKIRFLFISGVTRFGHLNIFSGFNNLYDISLENRYAAICGITEEELTENLDSGIEKFAEFYKINKTAALSKLKGYYDGYHFSQALIDIYNPFSLLSCLSASRLTSRWFQSGSSRYLLDKLKSNSYDLSNLEGIKVGEDVLMGVDSSMNDSVTLLYQSGYLTIKSYDILTYKYTLGIPNYEVSTALYSIIVPYYLGQNYSSVDNEAYGFIEMLKNG